MTDHTDNAHPWLPAKDKGKQLIFLGQRSTVSRAVAASHVLIDVPPRRVPVRASANLALAHSPTPDRLPAVAGWDRALRGFVMLAPQRLRSS